MVSRLLFAVGCLTRHMPSGPNVLVLPPTISTKLGVDELFSVQVTSVGRKAQKISKAPAAVFVLTAEDIRRSGATSIPEALRWVPGLTFFASTAAPGSSRLAARRGYIPTRFWS